MSRAQQMSMHRFTSPEIQFLLRKSEGRCWYCGTALIQANCTVEHLTALRNGGDDHHENLVAACRPCNISKGSKTLEQFRELMTRRCAGAPKFTDDQIAYLAQHGIELPELDPYVFWFEESNDVD